MKLHGIKPMQDMHVNVTPLIDIVMCLIIFFLLVGHIAKQASIKGVRIPVAANGKGMTNRSNELIINVVPRHSSMAGVQRRPRIWVWGQQVRLGDLGGLLRTDKRKHPNLKLILRADQSIHYRYIAPILADCAGAGIDSIHFMARRP